MRFLVAFLALLAAGLPMVRSQTFTGEDLNCPFTVHGRLRNYMGYAQMRIWIVGSTRIVGVEDETPESEKIAALFPESGWFDYAVYGDFTIEPLAPDIKGHKRPVRILKVKNVVMERDSDHAIILIKKEL
jgi:hypothetical protein